MVLAVTLALVTTTRPAEACSIGSDFSHDQSRIEMSHGPADTSAASTHVFGGEVVEILDVPHRIAMDQVVIVRVESVVKGSVFHDEVVGLERGMCGMPTRQVRVGEVLWFAGELGSDAVVLGTAYGRPPTEVRSPSQALPGRRPGAPEGPSLVRQLIGPAVVSVVGAAGILWQVRRRRRRLQCTGIAAAGGVTESEGEPPHG